MRASSSRRWEDTIQFSVGGICFCLVNHGTSEAMVLHTLLRPSIERREDALGSMNRCGMVRATDTLPVPISV